MNEINPAQTTTFSCVVNFIREHFSQLEYESGCGITLQFPKFDLMPHHYLEYANESLGELTEAGKINCIGHLKRATECEADTFLFILNLSHQARSMNFPKKLEMIENLGLMPSRSVTQLNRIRNKVEHEYAIPQIEDLSLYFDLVTGLVAVVEGAVFMLATCGGEMRWYYDAKNPVSKPHFSFEYSLAEPSIKFEIFDGQENFKYLVQPDEWNTFLSALNILFLLIRGGMNIVSKEYVLRHLPV